MLDKWEKKQKQNKTDIVFVTCNRSSPFKNLYIFLVTEFLIKTKIKKTVQQVIPLLLKANRSLKCPFGPKCLCFRIQFLTDTGRSTLLVCLADIWSCHKKKKEERKKYEAYNSIILKITKHYQVSLAKTILFGHLLVNSMLRFSRPEVFKQKIWVSTPLEEPKLKSKAVSVWGEMPLERFTLDLNGQSQNVEIFWKILQPMHIDILSHTHLVWWLIFPVRH